MTMDYGVFELESDDNERTRRLRDASIRATDLALTEPTISREFLEVILKYSSPHRPCGCKRRGRHRKVCPESAAKKHPTKAAPPQTKRGFDKWKRNLLPRIFRRS